MVLLDRRDLMYLLSTYTLFLSDIPFRHRDEDNSHLGGCDFLPREAACL